MRLGLGREPWLKVEELGVEMSGDWDLLGKKVGSKESAQREEKFLS